MTCMMFLLLLLLGMGHVLAEGTPTTSTPTTEAMENEREIALWVLVPAFLIAVALMVVFVVCWRKAVREKRAALSLTSDDFGNDTADTVLTNEHALVDIEEKEVTEVNGLGGRGSAGSEDPGHGCNGPSERFSSNGSLRRESDVVVGCTEVNVVVHNEVPEGDCAVVASAGKQDKDCDVKLLVEDETDAGAVGIGVGDRDDGSEAGTNCMNENSIDDIGGEALETGTVLVSTNSTVNGISQDSGVKDGELRKETGLEEESRNVLTEAYRGQYRFEGNYETIGEEQFGDGGEKEDDVGLGIEDDNLPVRDLGECGEHVGLEEDNYATIGGNVGVETEVIVAGRENANPAEGFKTGGVGGGPGRSTTVESNYCEIGGDDIPGIAKKKDAIVGKKKEKKEKKEKREKREKKEKKSISLKHHKRPKGGSHLGTSGHKPVEEPTYAVVDLEKKKRSRSEKGPAGSAFSADTDLYDRLDRNRSKSSVGQSNNYNQVEPQGPGSDVSGGKKGKKTFLVVNDIYSTTAHDWRQRKGSVADDNADKNGVSDEAHDGIASYSDAKKCETKDLDARLEEGQQERNKSCKGEDVEVENEAFGNDAPKQDVDPDYASVNNSEVEDEEDHYATVGELASPVASKEERSSNLSSCDEVHLV